MTLYILIVIFMTGKQMNAAVYETAAHCERAKVAAIARDDVKKAECDPTELETVREDFQ